MDRLFTIAPIVLEDVEDGLVPLPASLPLFDSTFAHMSECVTMAAVEGALSTVNGNGKRGMPPLVWWLIIGMLIVEKAVPSLVRR